MEKSMIIAGFGGQGVMVCGQLIGYSITETTDNYVTFLPSYGAEQRGGTANCFVVISDNPVGSPKPFPADYVMVLNDPSLERFEDSVLPGGTLFVNSDVVSRPVSRTDVDTVFVPANSVAIDLGNPKVANLVMLGAFVGYTGLIEPEKVLETVYRKLGKKRPELNPLNKAAFEKGMEIGTSAKNAS